MKLIRADISIGDTTLLVDKVYYIFVRAEEELDEIHYFLSISSYYEEYDIDIFSSTKKAETVLLKEKLTEWMISDEKRIFDIAIEKRNL